MNISYPSLILVKILSGENTYDGKKWNIQMER